MQKTFIRPLTDEERRTMTDWLAFLEKQSTSQSAVTLKYWLTLGATFSAFVGVAVLLRLTDLLPLMICVHVLLGFAGAGVLQSPLFERWQMTGNYLAQIARHQETLTRGQRRVQQVEAVAVAVLRFADDEDGDDYEVFFCDLGDSTVLCLSGDAVTEASQDGEFPCLRFERLGYPDGGGFDTTS